METQETKEESFFERWDHADYCLQRAFDALVPLRTENDPHDIIDNVIDLISSARQIVKGVKGYRYGNIR